MKELADLYYLIDDLLSILNKLSTYPQPINHSIALSNEFVNIETNFKFNVSFKKHIERINASIEIIKHLREIDNYDSYITYSNSESLFLSATKLSDKISESLVTLEEALAEINKFNDKFIREIIFNGKEATIISSGSPLNNYTFKYDLCDIFLMNEKIIDVLIRCFGDISTIRDGRKNKKILKTIEDNMVDIEFIGDLKNKKDEIDSLIHSLLNHKNFIKNISANEINFQDIISSYGEMEGELLKKSNTLETSIAKAEKELRTFTAKTGFVNEIYDSIKKDESSINKALESIDEINKTGAESREINVYISSKKSEINDILDNAKKTIKILSGSSIAKHLNNQEKKEKWAAGGWLISSMIILTFSVIQIIYSFNKYGLTPEWIVLKILTLPILLSALVFTMRQYVKRKNIIDSYAYKKTLALSLTGFKKQIDKSINDEKQVDYILKAIAILTDPPLNDLEKNHVKNELEVLEKIRESLIDNILSTIHPQKDTHKKDK
ncbi:TPA: hypothetical protein PC598_000100 [Morganella morganii]|nr:hypothetical protein [Morganella morganii]